MILKVSVLVGKDNLFFTALAWVLDVSAVAADGRRTLRVEKQATHSKAGNEHPNLGSTLACVC